VYGRVKYLTLMELKGWNSSAAGITKLRFVPVLRATMRTGLWHHLTPLIDSINSFLALFHLPSFAQALTFHSLPPLARSRFKSCFLSCILMHCVHTCCIFHAFLPSISLRYVIRAGCAISTHSSSSERIHNSCHFLKMRAAPVYPAADTAGGEFMMAL